MKRLARIPTVFALVAMVAACTDMTAPEVTPPQLRHGQAIGQCPPGWRRIHFIDRPTPAEVKADVNGDGFVCERPNLGIFIDNLVPIDVELPNL